MEKIYRNWFQHIQGLERKWKGMYIDRVPEQVSPYAPSMFFPPVLHTHLDEVQSKMR